MSFFHKYPYSDEHELNLDWIISEIKKVNREWSDFQVINSIRFFGNWLITEQYPKWALVSKDNVGYLSVEVVPAGVPITDADYWKPIADYSALLADMQQRIVEIENKISHFSKFEDFGAVGDGITDDTSAIKEAIQYAEANKVTLTSNNGTYLISDDLSITGIDLINFGTIKSENFNTITANEFSRIDNGIFDGCVIDCSGYHATLQDITVKNITSGSAITLNNRNGSFTDNKGKYCFRNILVNNVAVDGLGVTGIDVECSDVTLENCEVISCETAYKVAGGSATLINCTAWNTINMSDFESTVCYKLIGPSPRLIGCSADTYAIAISATNLIVQLDDFRWLHNYNLFPNKSLTFIDNYNTMQGSVLFNMSGLSAHGCTLDLGHASKLDVEFFGGSFDDCRLSIPSTDFEINEAPGTFYDASLVRTSTGFILQADAVIQFGQRALTDTISIDLTGLPIVDANFVNAFVMARVSYSDANYDTYPGQATCNIANGTITFTARAPHPDALYWDTISVSVVIPI